MTSSSNLFSKLFDIILFFENFHFIPSYVLFLYCSLLIDDNDIFNLFYHILHIKHFICQFSLQSEIFDLMRNLYIYNACIYIHSIKHKYTLQNGGLSCQRYLNSSQNSRSVVTERWRSRSMINQLE